MSATLFTIFKNLKAVSLGLCNGMISLVQAERISIKRTTTISLRYLPKNGTVWFDTNNQSGYETYLHYGETSSDWYTATKYPFDYGYIYEATYSYRVVFAEWESSTTYGFLDFGDSTYYDPAEAFKLRFKSNSDGASGSQYESFYDQWASATEAEPMSSFPSVMTGVWNGQVWENYVDSNSGSSSDYKPSDYTTTSWYNYISFDHAFVGKIQNEANSAHIGVSFVFFDRTDTNDMSSIQQMGTGPCTPCDDGKDSVAGTSAADAAGACTAFCPAGKYNDGSGRGCSKCPRSRYAASAGMSECTDCGSGYYSDDTGGTSSSHCLACPAGTYSLSDTYLPSCEHCRDSISCVDCPYGYYGTTTGSSGCTGCPAGKPQLIPVLRRLPLVLTAIRASTVPLANLAAQTAVVVLGRGFDYIGSCTTVPMASTLHLALALLKTRAILALLSILTLHRAALIALVASTAMQVTVLILATSNTTVRL